MRTFTFLSASLLLASHSSAWVNNDVTRKIDASSSIVRHTVTVQASNDEKSDFYHFVIPESNLSSTAMLKFSVKKGSGFSPAVYNKDGVKDGFAYYKISLPTEVQKEEKVTLKLRMSQAGVLRPLPATVKQLESQKVDYNDNAYFASPYTTTKQTTTVMLASPSLESYTSTPKPVSHSGSNLVFGEYKNIKPFSSAPLRFHGVNNKAFCKATSVRRIFEISMWGNLAVEEWYHIEHAGAKLKGTFSRLDYSTRGNQAPSSFTTLTAKLPAASQDIYFRDDIGNISTSKVGYAKDPEKGTRDVQFTQRFPLFGGWKTRFYFGYNLPLHHVLTTGRGVNKLKVPFGTSIKDIWVENMTVEVVLPEGVPVPKVFISGAEIFDFEVLKRASYLDYSGRTVVVLKDNMLASPERNEELEVDFLFTSSDLIWEPFYLFTAFMVLFISMIVLSQVVG